jgi:predicted Zn-dependent protease
MKPALLFSLVALALVAPLRAQTAPAKKEISESAAAGFVKLQPLVNAKNYPAALTLIEQLLSAAPETSYDAYVLSQLQAQVLLTQGRYAETIPFLERAQALAAGNANFFDLPAHLERAQLLAQLHYQLAAAQKTPDLQRAGYEKALARLRDWLARSEKPSAEIRLFAASILYNLATLDAKPDAALLREAVEHAREALLLSPRPGNQARLVLVACHLQLAENDQAAELLELLAAEDPKNASVWSQIQSLYLAAAADAAAPEKALRWNLRALLAIERAQAHGHSLSPKDNYTRIAILFNLGQFSAAAALLERGLADGTLENNRRNWELLSSSYQQVDRPDRAIDALGRAIKAFPEDGALELSLAQLLYGSGRVADAYERGRAALAKPGVEKRGQAGLYLAFLAYELQRYEDAARWVAEARGAGDAPAASLDQLQRAVSEALSAREALTKS